MPIGVTNRGIGRRVSMAADERRYGSLTVTGLAAGANTIPHGLPFIPSRLSFRPSALGLWGETAAPDATNIYVTVGTGGALSGAIDYEE